MKYIFCLLSVFFLSTISFAEEPVTITDISVAEIAAEKTNTKLLLVFTADWCRVCTYLETDITKDSEILNKYTVCYIDYDSNKNLVRKYNISAVPTSVLVDKNKNIVRSYKGRGPVSSYKNWLGF